MACTTSSAASRRSVLMSLVRTLVEPRGRPHTGEDCLSSGRHEFSGLPLTPGKLIGSDRAPKQFVGEPNPISVEDVTFTIPRHLLYLTPQNHFLHPAAVNPLGLARQPS